MNSPDIRELLTQLAEPVTSTDLSADAWDAAVGRRRRRRVGAVAGAAVAALVVTAGSVALRNGESDSRPIEPTPDTVTAPTTPRIKDFDVAVAPRFEEEADLEPLAWNVMPATIDLSAPNPSVQQEPIESAVAAFGVWKVSGDAAAFDSVMLVTRDGDLRHLDVDQLEPLQDQAGNGTAPFGAGSLSPEGTRLAFVQPDGVAVYSIQSGEWSDYDVPRMPTDTSDFYWVDKGTLRIDDSRTFSFAGSSVETFGDNPLEHPGVRLTIDDWWGAEHRLNDLTARGINYLIEDVPVDRVDSHPPAIAVAGRDQRLLLIPDQGQRWKNCCAVAGWADGSTLAYESRSGEAEPGAQGQLMRIVAWDIETDEFALVSTITGSADMTFQGSYADLVVRQE